MLLATSTPAPSESPLDVGEVAEATGEVVVDLASTTIVLGIGAFVGIVLMMLLFLALFRFWRTPFGMQARSRGRTGRRLAGAALGALVAQRTLELGPPVGALVEQGLVLLLVFGLTTFGVSLLRSAEMAAVETHDTATTDNLHARRRRTQFLVLRRVGTAFLILLGLALALLTFPAARTIGQSLLASAGVIGIVVGVAAQGSLKNLVAGIQIAAAEPIRLGDAVLLEGEWGVIEDITVTTVVVKTWDRRRLVYPTSWFVENPFQNWTRKDSQLLGQVTLVLDHRTDVERLRDAAREAVAASERWDGEAFVLQVIDADEHGMTVRVLMTAVDAPTSWELRCEVREALLRWLVANDPKALPTHRLLPHE